MAALFEITNNPEPHYIDLWEDEQGNKLEAGSKMHPFLDEADIKQYFRETGKKIRIEGKHPKYGFTLVCDHRAKGDPALKKQEYKYKTMSKRLDKSHNCKYQIRLKKIEESTYTVLNVNHEHNNHKNPPEELLLTEKEIEQLLPAIACHSKPRHVLAYVRENFKKKLTYSQLNQIKRQHAREIALKSISAINASPQALKSSSQFESLLLFLETAEMPFVMYATVKEGAVAVGSRFILKIPGTKAELIPEIRTTELCLLDRVRQLKGHRISKKQVPLHWESKDDVPLQITEINASALPYEEQWKDVISSISANQQLEFYSISFCHAEQLELFARFPHVLGVDTTCKSNEHNRPFGMLTGVDGNSKTIVPITFFSVDETRASFSTIFTSMVPWILGEVSNSISTIYTDGDDRMRQAISASIQRKLVGHEGTCLKLCFFHAITQPVMRMRSSFANCSSELYKVQIFLKRMAKRCTTKACVEEQFSKIREWVISNDQFTDSQTNAILGFLEEVELKQDQWLRPFQKHSISFGTIANSRNEAENRVLKDDKRINNGSSLMTTASVVHEIYKQRIIEYKYTCNRLQNLRPRLNPEERESGFAHLYSMFTRKCMDLLFKQYKCSKDYAVELSRPGSFKVTYLKEAAQNNGLPAFPLLPHKVSVHMGKLWCDCLDTSSYLIPCRHVIAIKRGQVDQKDIHPRWLTKWYSGDLPAFKIIPESGWGATISEEMLNSYNTGQLESVRQEQQENREESDDDNDHDNENNAIDRANNNTTNSNATNYAELKYQFDDTFKAVCSMIGENPAFVEMVSRHLAIFARNIRQEVEELSAVNQLQGDGSAFFDGAHAVKHGRANSRRNKAFYERGIRTTLADGHSTKPKGRRRKRKGQVEGNNSGDEFEDTLASQEMEHEKSPKRSRREYDADSTESLSMEQVESNDSEDGCNISAPMAYHRDQLIMQEDDHASQSETPKSLYQQFQSLHTQPLVKSQRRQNLPSRFKDTVSLL